MKLALLAGGKATRLYPKTMTIAKSMVEVAGEPFIDHQLRLLCSQGVREVVLCIGQFAEQIQEHVGSGAQFSMNVEYSVETGALLGTGGALKKALPMLGEQFWVMYGDSYLPVEFVLIERSFTQCRAPALMTVYRNHNRYDTSNVEFKDDTILRYDKKHQTPAMEYIDYGLGILSAELFSGWPVDTAFDLSEIYGTAVERRQLAGYEVTQRFYEIGSPAGLAETEGYLAGNSLRQ